MFTSETDAWFAAAESLIIEVSGENSAEYTKWSNLEKRQVARSDQEF